MWHVDIFLFALQIVLVQSSMAPTHLHVTRVGPCSAFPGARVTVSELSISTSTYDSSLSGQLNISNDIENGWRIKATMQKCKDIRNVDTCDYFKSFLLVRNGCDDDDDGDAEFYTMLFHYAHPRLECPVQAGVYTIAGYPFFTEDNYLMVSESKISTSVFGYTYRLDGFTRKGQKIFCVEAYLQLLYIRNHDWVTNKTINIDILSSKQEENNEESTKTIDHSDEENNEGAVNVERESNKSEEDSTNDEKANGDEGDVNEDDENDEE